MTTFDARGFGRFARTGLAVLVGCLTLVVGGCETGTDDTDLRYITLGEVRTLTGGADQRALLVDPRSPEQFEAERIPGAVNVPLSSVSEDRARRDPRLEGYKTLVVYADDPGDPPGAAMAKRLIAAGYRNVRLFAGGLAEWKRAGLETDP